MFIFKIKVNSKKKISGLTLYHGCNNFLNSFARTWGLALTVTFSGLAVLFVVLLCCYCNCCNKSDGSSSCCSDNCSGGFFCPRNIHIHNGTVHPDETRDETKAETTAVTRAETPVETISSQVPEGQSSMILYIVRDQSCLKQPQRRLEEFEGSPTIEQMT